MRVLIADPPAVRNRKKSGVGYYAQELTRGLRRVAGEDSVLPWFPSNWLSWRQRWLSTQCMRYEAATCRGGKFARVEVKLRGKLIATVRSLFPIMEHPYRVAVSRLGCDVYHEPNFIPIDIDLPTIVSVHDLSVLRYPEWHPPKRVAQFETLFRRGLERASRLIAISEFGKSEIVRHLGWSPEKVSVTLMGVRPELHPAPDDELKRGMRALGLSPGYLLHVGTLEPRKNLLMLLKAYCALPTAVRDRHPLVLVGGGGWNSEQLHSYIRGEAKDRNVRWLGYVPNEHFSALYSGARALVFPTFYEGFGMPTIEMMACGGAVLASTAGAVAETVGDKVHLIDPHDEAGWRDAMNRVCTDDDWWRMLRTGAEEAARPFTWDRCAVDTLTAYQLTLTDGMPAKKAA